MNHHDLFDLLLVTCCGYALWKGGAPERITAAIFFVGVVLTSFAGPKGPLRWTSVEMGVLTVDIAALIGFTLVALHAERFWPIWLTALHAIAVAGHAVKIADPDLLRWGYAFALAVWSYPMLLLIAGGTWCHRRRLARDRRDPDWSSPIRRAKTGAAAA